MLKLTRRNYNLSVIGLMAIYSVLCFAVPEILKTMRPGGSGLMALIVGAAPAYPLAAVLALYVGHLNRLDEFQQKIQLLSLAISTGLILIAGTAYGFVVLHLEYPEFPLFLILPVFVVLWCICGWILKRRYA